MHRIGRKVIAVESLALIWMISLSLPVVAQSSYQGSSASNSANGAAAGISGNPMPHAYRSLTYPGQSTSSYYTQRPNQPAASQNQQTTPPQNSPVAPAQYQSTSQPQMQNRQPAPDQSATVSQNSSSSNGFTQPYSGGNSRTGLSGNYPSLIPNGANDLETFMYPFDADAKAEYRENGNAIQSVSDYYGINLHGGQQNGGVGVRRRGNGKGMSQMK